MENVQETNDQETQISLRFKKEELALIDNAANKDQRTRSSLLRHSALNYAREVLGDERIL